MTHIKGKFFAKNAFPDTFFGECSVEYRSRSRYMYTCIGILLQDAQHAHSAIQDITSILTRQDNKTIQIHNN